MSKIKGLLLLGMLCSGALGVAAQEPCKRNVEPQGGFSLCAPEGWRVTDSEGEKYKRYFAPAGERFTANINMKDAVSAVTLDEYVTAAIDHVLKNYAQFGASSIKVLTRESLTTKSGLAAIKVTFRSEYKDLLIRTIQYVLSANPREKLILTCTGLETDQVTLDPVCARAVETFRLEEKTNPPRVE